MLTYLDAVLHNEQALVGSDQAAVKLAGALYMHIQNPTLKPKDIQGGFEAALLKKNRYKGILLDDPQLLEHLDSELQQGNGTSKVYPFARKKDGAYSGGRAASLVTNDQLERLLQHNSQLIIAAAEAIFAGEIQLNPIRLNDKTTALQYSPYLSIMQFDAMLAENAYRDLPPLSAKQVLDLLKTQKGGENHE